MAGHKVAGREFSQLRIIVKAFFLPNRTTGIEVTTHGRIGRAGYVTFQDNALTFSFNHGIRNRNGR